MSAMPENRELVAAMARLDALTDWERRPLRGMRVGLGPMPDLTAQNSMISICYQSRRPQVRQAASGSVGPERLSGEAVSLIVKERAAAAGINPAGFSGHSLRAGFATSAVQAGVSTLKIRSQTGHASDAMLARYVRDGELFVDNAAGVLL